MAKVTNYRKINTYTTILMLMTNLIFISSINIKHINESEKLKVKKPLEISNYDYPKNKENIKDSITVAILGTNDIHGQAFEKAEIPYGPEQVRVGGYKLLSGFIDIIRKEFGANSLWLDAGDQFTGTYEKELTKGKLMTDFYNIMKVDGVAIGNHEWDKKEPQLRDWMKAELGSLYDGKNQIWSADVYGKNGKNLYLDANLKPKDSNVEPLPNQMPSRIYEFENRKIKIGVIGLTTLETIVKTSGFSKNTFDILEYKDVIEKTSKLLRNQGAQAVLILSHVGMDCKPNDFTRVQIDELYELKLRNNSFQAANVCQGEVMKILQEVDQSSIDGIIAGHIHDSVHHFHNEIAVVQNPINNIFANVLYLNFHKNKNGTYTLQRKNTLIEGPIPLCSKVYTNNKRCNTYQDLTDKVSFTDFTFHKQKLVANKKVEELFETQYADVNKKIAEYKNTIVCKTEVLLERNVKKEHKLGNLITDIIRKATKSDVAMFSPGGFRYTWDRGLISKYSLNNMFPFGGHFGSYKIKGNDLKKIVVALQQEAKLGYLYAFSGIKMTLVKQSDKYVLDLNSLVLDNGNKIEDEKEYTFGSGEFFLSGGDDMAFVKDQIQPGPIENKIDILDAVEAGLKNIKVITKNMADSLLGRIIYKNAS